MRKMKSDGDIPPQEPGSKHRLPDVSTEPRRHASSCRVFIGVTFIACGSAGLSCACFMLKLGDESDQRH